MGGGGDPEAAGTPGGASKTCPACGQSGASFSKSQSKKRQSDRKFVDCVHHLLSPRGSGQKDPQGSQPARDAAPSSSLKSPHKSDLPSATHGKKGEKRRRDRSHISGDAMTNNNHDDGPRKGDEASANGSKKSRYFQGRPSSAKENVGNGGKEAAEEESGGKIRTTHSDSDSDDSEGGWSPLRDEADAKAEIGKLLGAQMEGGDSILEGTPAAASRKRPGKSNLRNKKGGHSRMDGPDEDSDEDMMDSDDAREESLEAMKRRILGRSVHSIYDAQAAEAALSSSSPILEAKGFAGGEKLAAHLRDDLACQICQDRLYNPVSLLCGHSFCGGCLAFWLERARGRRRDAMDDDDGDSEEENGNGNVCTCPACREPIPQGEDGKPPQLKVNTALKAVLDALFGAEMHRRRLAEERQERKGRAGEMGGMHARGCEELEPLPDEDELDHLRGSTNRGMDREKGWTHLHSKTGQSGWQKGSSKYNHAGSGVSIRRNIVLDENDQRYQLSLGFTRCTYSLGRTDRGILDVELCLLSMEEDEVDDSGFPTFVTDGDDDEALICAGSDRVHTLVESSARVVPVSAVDDGATSTFGRTDNQSCIRDLQLSRGMIGQDGSVRFRIDVTKALEGSSEDGEELRVAKLRFRHGDTGAVLELRLPSSKAEIEDLRKSHGEDEIEFCSARETPVKDGASRYMLDDRAEDEESDGEQHNEYEEDGFLVNDDREIEEASGSDEDHDDEEEEDDGHCQICDRGGDLLVCDGGDHAEGCGRMYHVRCIGRREVPPGDWVCGDCAYLAGRREVGIEGHEYDGEGGGEAEAPKKKPLVLEDSDDDSEPWDEAEDAPKEKKKKRKIEMGSDSDSE